MYNYRVVKVIFDDNIEKYAAQKKHISTKVTGDWLFIPIQKKVVSWGTLLKISDGTDNLIPAFYNTKEDAWERIKKDENDMKLSTYKYKITDEYYENS